MEGGGGWAWTEGADADVGTCEFFVDGFVEVEDKGFRGSIECEVRVGLKRGG